MTRHAYVLGRNEDDCKALFGEIDRGCQRPPEAYANDLGSRADPHTRRPVAAAMLRDQLVRGDHLIVLQLADLGATLSDVVSVVNALLTRAVRLISVRDRLDTADATGDGAAALRTLSASLARAAEQLGAARAEWQREQGRRGGRPSKLGPAGRDRAIEMRREGQSIAAMVRELGVCRTTIYRTIEGIEKGAPQPGPVAATPRLFDDFPPSEFLHPPGK